MFELTGEIVDERLPLLFPPEYFDEVMNHISTGAKRADRRPDDLDIAGCIWFSVSRDPEAAKGALRELVTYYGPHLVPDMIGRIGLTSQDFDPIREALSERDHARAKSLMTDEMAQLAIHGTPEDCLERIEGLIEKVLRHVRFEPPLGPSPVETIHLIGEEIIPHIRK
ncbi:MAG: LLM class flavin-dependent oxidoreductase [Candidatus Bathyarchaeota archaeon]|nr:MAG: LLM class flavin-dependent oxidoreductase [Candidatus Bathyarchaeota archaeon]